MVVFSDKKLKSDSVALQMREQLTQNPKAQLASMDLRAPGQVTLEVLQVRPADMRK